MLRDKCPDLLSIVGDIVGGSDDWAFFFLQALRYVAGFLYFLRMERVPAYRGSTFSAEFIETGHTPHIGLYVKVFLQKICRGQRFS